MGTSFSSFVENLNSLISEVHSFENLEQITEAAREKVAAAKMKVLNQYSALLREKEELEHEATQWHGTL